MLLARQLAFSASLIAFAAVAVGCTSSEPIEPGSGSGGSSGSGSGGMIAGSGGMMAGTDGGSGGMVAGSGGMMAGSGGTRMDAGMDTARDAGMDAGGGGMLTFAKDVGPLLMMRCGTCHGTSGGLMVNSLASVTGNATSTCNKVDASKKRVVPGNPTASFLYIKVSTPTAMLTGCGNQMPRNGPPFLSTAEQATIHDWIMQGAH